MTISSETELPFSYPVNIRTLAKKGRHEKYIATEEVRTAIAMAYDIISVESFVANCLLTPWKRDGAQLSGNISATITQPCAVSFEPLQANVDETYDLVFVPQGSKHATPKSNDEGEWVFELEGNELPETFIGDSIEMAAVWLEFFDLGIDLFARKDGEVFQGSKDSSGEEKKPESPFAALAAMKKH